MGRAVPSQNKKKRRLVESPASLNPGLKPPPAERPSSAPPPHPEDTWGSAGRHPVWRRGLQGQANLSPTFQTAVV